MIDLHTLGSLDLKGPAGADCRAVLAQPKRLGLLVYLAAAAPRRFHRRDSLLALFWPDLDTAHARAALRRTLYFLRTALGGEVVVSRGDDEVGAADGLWCDAAEFETALAAGDAGRALELYRGDLLEGFYVAGAPEYQDWLDRERGRLRGLAAGAAWHLADEAKQAGRADEAARHARRAAELSPDDERALRHLIGLLEESGDRAGALRAYEDFARRLAADFELEPAAETRALITSIRTHTRTPSLRSGQAAEPLTIAIFPFAIRGDPQLAYLGEGMVDLLTTQLDGTGALRMVDPRALLRHLARDGWKEQDPASAAAVAAHFGAGRFILGTILGAGGRLHATAALYDESGSVESNVQASAAGEGDFFAMVDDLARQLLAGPGAGPGARLSRLAATTTTSIAALKAYLLGESHLRAGRYYDAMDALRRAVAADDTFALAYYRFAAAAAGCGVPELARQLAELGARHRDRLSPHDRVLFDAQRAWLAGAVTEAEAHYAAITGTHPDDTEAWFLLGDLLFHSNPLRGRSATEARGPFERALELEPDHVTSLVHLVRIAALEGHFDEAIERASRVIELSPAGDEVLAMRAFRGYASGDAEEIASVHHELERARAAALALAFTDVVVYAGDITGAESFTHALIGAARSDEMRALCHVLLAHLALAREDPGAALAELATAEGFDRAWGLETRALFAALPFGGIEDEDAEQTRDALLAWDANRVPASSFMVFAMHNGLHAHIRLYLLTLLEVRLGRIAVARGHAAALGALEPAPGAAPMSRHLSRGAEARIMWAEGNLAGALAVLEGEQSEAWFLLTVASPFYSQAFERYMRAELLRALGRIDEARGWYASIAERSPYEIIYRIPTRPFVASTIATAS